jgi:hypothetical protein
MPSCHFPHWPRLLACVCVVLLTACGDSSVPPEKFAQEYATALCERSGRCDTLAPYLIDKCKAQANDRIHAEDVKRAIAAGRLVYDEIQGQRCLDGINQTRCLAQDVDDSVTTACQQALRGTVQGGAECSFLFECAAGTCGGTAETTCPATCPEVLAEGDTCSNFRGPRCNANAGLRCSAGMCVTPAGLDASCQDNAGCKSGLLCVDEKCAPLATVGAGCSVDSSCAEGLYCEDSVCVTRKQEGQRCSSSPEEVDAALRGAQCADGLLCQGAGLDSMGTFLPGTCVKPSKEAGACKDYPPDVQIYITGCLNGLDCNDSKCVVPPTSGTCGANNSCRTDTAYCSSDNVCVTQLPDGAACNIPPECLSYNCPEGVCVPAVVYCHE